MNAKQRKRKQLEGQVVKSVIDTVAAAEPIRVTTLAELEAVVNEVVHVTVRLNKKELLVPVRRLSPAEIAKLEELQSAVRPPMKTNEEGKQEIDLMNQEYNDQLRKRMIAVRAQALWWACGLFRETWAMQKEAERPGSSTVAPTLEEITAFVQGRLIESVLEQLFSVARAEEVEVLGSLNF